MIFKKVEVVGSGCLFLRVEAAEPPDIHGPDWNKLRHHRTWKWWTEYRTRNNATVSSWGIWYSKRFEVVGISQKFRVLEPKRVICLIWKRVQITKQTFCKKSYRVCFCFTKKSCIYLFKMLSWVKCREQQDENVDILHMFLGIMVFMILF